MTSCYPVIDASFSRAGLRLHIGCIPNDMDHSQFILLEAVIRALMDSKNVEILYQIGKRIVVGMISENSNFSGCEGYSIEAGTDGRGKDGRRLNSFVGICYDYEKEKGILYPDHKQLSDILRDFYKDKWGLQSDNREQFYSSVVELELHQNNNDSDYKLIKSGDVLTVVKPSCSNKFIVDMINMNDSESHIYINKMPKRDSVGMGVKGRIERNVIVNMGEKIVGEIQIYCSSKSFFNGHTMIKK